MNTTHQTVVKTFTLATLLCISWVSSALGTTSGPSAYVVIQNDAFSESSRAIQVLSAQFLRDEGFQVQDPSELQRIAPDKDAISQLAQTDGVENVLFIEALPLDSAFLVSFTLTNALDGSILSSRQLTMDSMGEVRSVLQRGIRSLIRGETIEESAEFSTITRYESVNHRKRKGRVRGALGLSGGSISTATPESYYGALGRIVFEAEEFRVQGGLTILGSRDLTFAALGLGGAYLFFPEENTTPYIGFDVGWGGFTDPELEELRDEDIEHANHFEGSGFQVSVQTGWEFLRFYEARLLAELQFMIPLYQTLETTFGTHPVTLDYERRRDYDYKPLALLNMMLVF